MTVISGDFPVLLFNGRILLWTELALAGSWVLGTESELFEGCDWPLGTQEFLKAPYEATNQS